MSVFLNISDDDKIYSGVNFFLIKDRFPVSPGHVLIISNELKKDFFELNEEELVQLNHSIIKAKSLIDSTFNPIGYNIGMNCGLAAGQTIFHFHCHIIPRYQGDTQNPSGGVRGVIPNKQHY